MSGISPKRVLAQLVNFGYILIYGALVALRYS
jgi:hypothetical protein